MEKLYVTFGENHVHFINKKQLDKNCIGVFKCNTIEEGYVQINELFGNGFNMAFQEAAFFGGDLKHFPDGLKEIN